VDAEDEDPRRKDQLQPDQDAGGDEEHGTRGDADQDFYLERQMFALSSFHGDVVIPWGMRCSKSSRRGDGGEGPSRSSEIRISDRSAVLDP